MNMKNHHIALAALLALAACSDDITDNGGSDNRIQLAGDIEQMAVTRVNDSGFADGDVMGVYVVDYEGVTPGTLKANGNRANNVRHTFDEASGRWTPTYDIYWKDNHTHIDLYGYYPYNDAMDDIGNYGFEVRRDQSQASSGGDMGGYEASDFLWGKVPDVAPTASVIRLPLSHRMATARVTLTQGSGFGDGEWDTTEKSVLLPNLVRKATIDMATGTVTANGGVEATATMPSHVADQWRAIVVPQTVAAGTTLFTITVGGQPFKFARNDDFAYTAGMMSNFTIRVDKHLPDGPYSLTLVSMSITPWENDLVSHDATAREYVIVNSTRGHLRDSVEAAGRDAARLKNLKLTGSIDDDDFTFMREEMAALQSLNLKEATVYGHLGRGPYGRNYSEVNDGSIRKYVIGGGAFSEKISLLRLILPDSLVGIGECAFRNCINLSGSLTIPEGVRWIGASAFAWCESLTGTLSLPTTLETIDGGGDFDLDGLYGAFFDCHFNCELILPDNIRYIGANAFGANSGYYGGIRLPSKLKYIGDFAFAFTPNITGDLEIPQGVASIGQSAFASMGLNGNLVLHDGLTSIGGAAFSGTRLRGVLNLPDGLVAIGDAAFSGCDFSGELRLPKQLATIGNSTFAGNGRLTGVLEFPDGVESIGAGAFASCSGIEGLIFPESLVNIGGAFSDCFGIGSIVCRGETPPHVADGAFNGVPKDNFTLEVPEQAIHQYQAATGWKDFKRIAAHHELVCRPSAACALNAEHSETLTLYAEGEWEVASKPGWCTVSPSSGSGKTQLTLTISALAKGAANRKGNVVFRLKDKDYTHTCEVSQYGYEYGEDEWLTLQKATRGNNGGINIVLLGDGFDAKSIADGSYLKAIRQEAEYFFAIEPYKTYRDYFNVYTAMPLSQEAGVSTVNTISRNRFGTTFTDMGLRADYDALFDYALNAPTVTKDNLKETLIIVVPNSTDYSGITQMWTDGSAIAFCPLSNYEYPLDARGVIQHEAGGHGFGKLADEFIWHNAFIDACGCTCCEHVDAVNRAKSLGWYDNISLSGKTNAVPWSHLIYDSRYSDIVDIYEGAFRHSRGVFRSEQNSCMNNDIPYYNTISRESIVRRIKHYAGETFSFDDFVANDSREAGTVTAKATTAKAATRSSAATRAATSRQPSPPSRQSSPPSRQSSPPLCTPPSARAAAPLCTPPHSGGTPAPSARAAFHRPPVIHKGSPLKKHRRR